MLRIGCRWQDCPPEHGPYTTVYNRFNRWSARGIWQRIFETVAGSPEPPEQVALDSSHVKAHRCAGGGKGGRRNRRSASRGVGGTTVAPECVNLMAGSIRKLVGDKACDSNSSKKQKVGIKKLK